MFDAALTRWNDYVWLCRGNSMLDGIKRFEATVRKYVFNDMRFHQWMSRLRANSRHITTGFVETNSDTGRQIPPVGICKQDPLRSR
jgi:hypothetical protein